MGKREAGSRGQQERSSARRSPPRQGRGRRGRQQSRKGGPPPPVVDAMEVGARTLACGAIEFTVQLYAHKRGVPGQKIWMAVAVNGQAMQFIEDNQSEGPGFFRFIKTWEDLAGCFHGERHLAVTFGVVGTEITAKAIRVNRPKLQILAVDVPLFMALIPHFLLPGGVRLPWED